MTRKEHLEWCKKRAIEYIDRGDLNNALASFVSDMSKHDELINHPALKFLWVFMSTIEEARKFIEGFN